MRLLARQGAGSLTMLLISLAVAGSAAGQSGGNWPAVPPAELTASTCPGNPDASAAILDYEVMTNDITRTEDYSETIKICTAQGRHYGEVRIDYDPNTFRVKHIYAQTVKSSGTVIPFSGHVFQSRVIRAGRFRRYETSFAMPQVEAGDVIQYSYQLIWKGDLPGPFKNPDSYVLFAPTEFNTVRWKLVHSVFVQHEEFTWQSLRKFSYFSQWLGLPAETHLQKLPGGRLRVVLNNVGPFLTEPHMPPMDPLNGHLYIFYFMAPVDSNDSTPQKFVKDFWRGQGKLLAQAFEDFVGGQRNLQKQASKLTSQSESPLAKLRALYDRAQQIQNLDFEPEKTSKEEKAEDIKPNQNVKNILKHGYGTGYDVNAFFAALARGAGFDVHSVFVTDARSGMFDPNDTRWSQLDAQLVGVTVGNQQLYFDPATKYCPFGLLPWDEAGVEGFELDKKKGVLQATTPPPLATDAVTVRTGKFQLAADGDLTGTLTVIFRRQQALMLRLSGNNEDDTARRKILKDRVRHWLPSTATVVPTGSPDWNGEGPLTAGFTLTLPHFATVASGNLIFPMNMLDWDDANPYTDPKRVYPIYYRYPFIIMDNVSVSLPPGFTVSSLPPSKAIPGDSATYHESYQRQGNVIQFERQFSMLDRYIAAADYQQLKSFYDQVRSADGQMVVAQTAASASAN